MTLRKPPIEKIRLTSQEREKQIVLAAVEFFAEVGFSGDNLEMLRSRILEPVAIALREEFGLPDIQSMPLKTSEIELVWSINARIFYFGQRRWIFDVPIEDDVEEMIRLTIAHFMAGAKVLLPQIVQPQQLKKFK